MTDTKLIAIDFDGVLHSYVSGWTGPATIEDPPTPGALEFLRALLEDARFEVTIVSSRLSQPEAAQAMRTWLTEQGLEPAHLEDVVFAKTRPPAHLTIDDRAWTFSGQFPELDELDAFVPWNRQFEQDLGTQLRNMRRDATRAEDELQVPSIKKCIRCGGTHEDVTVQRFQRYEGDASHYTFCPATGEPMVVRVILQEDETTD